MTDRLIGRVTRCNIQGFAGGIRMTEPDLPTFGGLCRAPAQAERTQVVGLIYEISIEDDDLARQMAVADSPQPEARLDQQFVRPIPIEIRALSVGYFDGERIVYDLPPQPPVTLADIHSLRVDEVRRFTDSFDFLPLVLAAPEVPTDAGGLGTLSSPVHFQYSPRRHVARRFRHAAALVHARWRPALRADRR